MEIKDEIQNIKKQIKTLNKILNKKLVRDFKQTYGINIGDRISWGDQARVFKGVFSGIVVKEQEVDCLIIKEAYEQISDEEKTLRRERDKILVFNTNRRENKKPSTRLIFKNNFKTITKTP
jgi:phenolic acid decarboxylase